MTNNSNMESIRFLILIGLLSTFLLIKPLFADSQSVDGLLKNTRLTNELSSRLTDAVTVTVVSVKQEQRSQVIKNSGRISHKSEMRLSFKTGGLVKQIQVEEGDEVIAGQVLALLDLEEVDAQRKRVEANFKKAAADLKRFSKLYDEELVSLQVKQNAQSVNDAAQAELQIAEFNKKLSVIRAPMDGRVLKRYVESNELLQPGQAVFLLASSQQGSVVRVGLIDQDIVKLVIGDPASITLDAYPGKIFKGKVSEIALSTDSASGTFEVEVLIESKHLALRSGLIARVDITPTAYELQFYIPIESVFKAEKGMATIFILDEEKKIANKVEVEIVDISSDEVTVLGDLKVSDKVIKLGTPYLFDGSSVRLVDDSSTVQKY